MSFYSADALPRALTDLEGVLCAGGVMVLFGRGTAAQLEIVLGPPPEVPDDAEALDDAAGPDDAEGLDDAAGPDDLDAGSPGTDAPPSDDIGSASRDHRAPPRPGRPDAAPSGPDDHAWEEGIDEIPDDDLPVRPDDADPVPLPDARDPDARDPDPDTRDPDPDAKDPDPRDPDPPHRDPAPAAPPGTPSRRRAPAPPPPRSGIVVPDPLQEWRAHALSCAFRGRGVPAEVHRLPDGRPVVRSAYRADLVELAHAWHAGDGAKKVPGEFELDGPRLRLWVLAAGRHRGRAYTLGLDPHAPDTHGPLLTACQRAGLGATLAGDRDEPAVVVVGRRRQRRLAELVGTPPRHLAGDVWPVPTDRPAPA